VVVHLVLEAHLRHRRRGERHACGRCMLLDRHGEIVLHVGGGRGLEMGWREHLRRLGHHVLAVGRLEGGNFVCLVLRERVVRRNEGRCLRYLWGHWRK
jgi:hypothetical protein